MEARRKGTFWRAEKGGIFEARKRGAFSRPQKKSFGGPSGPVSVGADHFQSIPLPKLDGSMPCPEMGAILGYNSRGGESWITNSLVRARILHSSSCHLRCWVGDGIYEDSGTIVSLDSCAEKSLTTGSLFSDTNSPPKKLLRGNVGRTRTLDDFGLLTCDRNIWEDNINTHPTTNKRVRSQRIYFFETVRQIKISNVPKKGSRSIGVFQHWNSTENRRKTRNPNGILVQEKKENYRSAEI